MRIKRCKFCTTILTVLPLIRYIVTIIFQFVTEFPKKFQFFKFIYKNPLFFFLFGDRNLVGSRVEAVRKQKGMKQKELLAQLQVNGVDMNASGLSKLEGQIRFVTDVELVALADILEVSVDYLLGREN